jgi:hypothetical protein
MITRLLEILGLTAPPQPMVPIEAVVPDNEHATELRKAMVMAERIRRKADVHTEQARRMAESWEDLYLGGER